MAITELRPHLYRLTLGRYQAYLWHDQHSSTLIDTGEVGSAATIAKDLATLGLAPPDVDRLVLTHFHDDHTGSAADVAAWGPVDARGVPPRRHRGGGVADPAGRARRRGGVLRPRRAGPQWCE